MICQGVIRNLLIFVMVHFDNEKDWSVAGFNPSLFWRQISDCPLRLAPRAGATPSRRVAWRPPLLVQACFQRNAGAIGRRRCGMFT